MSMIFVPKSAQAQVPFAAADFPCVKHFFPCDEAAGTNTLSDIVGDVVFNYAGLTRSADGHAADTSSTAAQDTTGTWSTAGTKKVVFFTVASYQNGSSSSITVGTIAGNRVIQKGTASTVTSTNSTETTTTITANNFSQVSASTIYGRALVISGYNDANGIYSYNQNTTDTAAISAAVATTESVALAGDQLDQMGALTMGTGAFTNNAANTVIYGILWMEFDALPADLSVGLAWMTNRWANGEKVIYPGWKGLS